MSKRIFDLMAVIVTSPVWFPVFVLTVILMFIFEGRPILYQSNRRVGRTLNIKILKFRTMVRNAELIYNRENVPVVGQRFLNISLDSPLYTPLGRWLERFQITELPQIVHVVAGQMTIVGNRPLPENVIASLKEVYPAAEERFRTPAGLTGLVQLIGREHTSDGDRLALESHYCRATEENYSALLDMLVLLFTILIVLRLMQPYTVRQAHAFIGRFSPCSWIIEPAAAAPSAVPTASLDGRES